jgi:hypothetical protein
MSVSVSQSIRGLEQCLSPPLFAKKRAIHHPRFSPALGPKIVVTSLMLRFSARIKKKQ